MKKLKKINQFLEIIENINFHFLGKEKIDVMPQENGRIHLHYKNKTIFIDPKGKFSGACKR